MSKGQAFVFRADPNFHFLHCLRSAMHEKRSSSLCRGLYLSGPRELVEALHHALEQRHAGMGWVTGRDGGWAGAEIRFLGKVMGS